MRTPTPVPDWLVLDSGSHHNKCGVCLEECYSLLRSTEKTDRPADVHPIIWRLGQRANDTADPTARLQLAASLGCQRDTNDPAITSRLGAFAVRFSLERLRTIPISGSYWTEGRSTASIEALDAAAACLEDPSEANRIRARDAADAAAYAAAYAAADAAYAAASVDDAAAAAYAAYAAGGVAYDAAAAAYAAYAAGGVAYDADLFFAVIDEAERLLGRTECWIPTDEDWERVRAAL